MRAGNVVLHEGDVIAIDGSQGIVTADDVPLVDPADDPDFEPVLERLWTVLEWADDVRRLGIRANADTPADAKRAREFGAEGIGLCRTEHMFMAADRQPKMRAMIMADTDEDREAALDELLPLQQTDFEGIFEEMAGLPVTIRLLDPPLHEFLPQRRGRRAGGRARAHRAPTTSTSSRRPSTASTSCRRSTRCSARAACASGSSTRRSSRCRCARSCAPRGAVRDRTGKDAAGRDHDPARRLRDRARVHARRWSTSGSPRRRDGVKTLIGTMIELPRACFVANKIAKHADFFSFGTNDLTQSALGFSRDDVESRILSTYLEQKIIDRSPFETIDKPGVGWLVRLAAWVGREGHPGLQLGICGEHGGDPDSIAFFDMAGLDYVSCSPYRVPIARLAAAQSQLDPLRPITD